MGEIADMMLDGTMCEGCGEFLYDGADGPGFPQYCAACQADGRGYDVEDDTPVKGKPVGCPNCNKRFKTHEAYLQHYRDKHDTEVQAGGPGHAVR